MPVAALHQAASPAGRRSLAAQPVAGPTRLRAVRPAAQPLTQACGQCLQSAYTSIKASVSAPGQAAALSEQHNRTLWYGHLACTSSGVENQGRQFSDGADEEGDSSASSRALFQKAAHVEQRACSSSEHGEADQGSQSLDGAVEELQSCAASATSESDVAESLGVRAALLALSFYKGTPRELHLL